MPDDKPALAGRGFFKKPDYIFVFKNWKSMGGIYAYPDRLEMRRGFLNFGKTSETIYFRDIVSFTLHADKLAGQDFNPWIEIKHMKGSALENFEFYGGAGSPSGATIMIAEWMERKGVKRN